MTTFNYLEWSNYCYNSVTKVIKNVLAQSNINRIKLNISTTKKKSVINLKL